MTYREKAEQLFIKLLGANEYHAKDMVRLLEREGEYIPCALKALNAPDDLEDWDAECEQEVICTNCRHLLPNLPHGVICNVTMSPMSCKEAEPPRQCEHYLSRYIEFPLTVYKINNKFSEEAKGSLYKCGQLVKVRPCAEEYKGKTYIGILLGDLPVDAIITLKKSESTLNIGAMTNPAIFVPELNKIVYGMESWWSRIANPSEALKAISDDDIVNTWYIKLLHGMLENKEDKDDV